MTSLSWFVFNSKPQCQYIIFFFISASCIFALLLFSLSPSSQNCLVCICTVTSGTPVKLTQVSSCTRTKLTRNSPLHLYGLVISTGDLLPVISHTLSRLPYTRACERGSDICGWWQKCGLVIPREECWPVCSLLHIFYWVWLPLTLWTSPIVSLHTSQMCYEQ